MTAGATVDPALPERFDVIAAARSLATPSIPATRHEVSQIRSDRVSMTLFRNAVYEKRFCADDDVISLWLGNTRALVGRNSDRYSMIEMKAAEMNFHPAGTDVFFRPQSQSPTSGYIALALSTTIRRSIAEEFSPRVAGSLETSFDKVSCSRSLDLTRQARSLFQARYPPSEMVIESIAVLALCEVFRHSAVSKDLVDPTNRLGKVDLARVLDAIEAGLDTSLTPGSLAAIAGLSAYTFSASFKKSMGMSVHRYVQRRRLARAREMLEAGSCSLAEIAYAVGFSSQAHMTDVFRNSLGTTPGSYRRKHSSSTKSIVRPDRII